MDDKESRVLTHEEAELRVVDEGDGPKIRGYAAVFAKLSEDFGGWRERIMPGAFDGVLGTKHDVRALFNHDPNYVLGRTGAGTLELFVDERGLGYIVTPPKSRSDVIEAIQRGDVTGSSFAFTIDKDGDRWADGERGAKQTREVTKIKRLFDVGPVAYPAYPDTRVAVRSFSLNSVPARPAMTRRYLDHMIRRATS